MRRRLRPAVVAVFLCLAVLLAAPAGTTRAAFSDTATVRSVSATTFTVAAPAQTCSNTTSGVTLTFTPTSAPGGGPSLGYSAASSSGPNPSVPATGNPRVITVRSNDYNGLLALGAQFTVTVTASLPSSSWTQTSSTTLQMTSVLGLLNRVSCVS